MALVDVARVLTLVVPRGGGGQFDPGFHFEPWTSKMGAMAILVYCISLHDLWPSEDLTTFGALKKVKNQHHPGEKLF